jgi:hypothetical protein
MPSRGTSERVRLALTGTPRSGNSWLRLLLSSAYGCESLASHSSEEVPWDSLPDDLVLQMHSHPDADLTSTLQEHGFRTIVLGRHPLDVLISILHYARADSSPARWLAGEGGDEISIVGSSPLDSAFLEYATGPRAKALLGLSREWWVQPDAVRLTYEALCGDVVGVLEPVLAQIARPKKSIEKAAAAHTLDHLRRTISSHHFWRGRPGHWRTLLTQAESATIAEAHRESFELFGYELDPDPDLDEATARSNWSRIAGPLNDVPHDSFRAVRATDAAEIRGLRAERFALLAELAKERAARRSSEATVNRLHQEAEAQAKSLARLQAAHDETARWADQVAKAQRAEIEWRESIEKRLREELTWRTEVGDQLSRDIDSLGQEVDSLHRQAAASESALAALVASRSFRYTAPLRSIGRLVRRLAPG